MLANSMRSRLDPRFKLILPTGFSRPPLYPYYTKTLRGYMSIALWGIKVTRIAQIAQKGVCIDGTSFTKQPRFTNVCSSAHEPYVHRLTDPMFVGLWTYYRLSGVSISLEWNDDLTRVKLWFDSSEAMIWLEWRFWVAQMAFKVYSALLKCIVYSL